MSRLHPSLLSVASPWSARPSPRASRTLVTTQASGGFPTVSQEGREFPHGIVTPLFPQ